MNAINVTQARAHLFQLIANVNLNSEPITLTNSKGKNAVRKLKFSHPLKFQIRVTQEEKEFISFARENHLNYSTLMQK